MKTSPRANGASRRGFALVIALGLLAVLACLAAHFCVASSGGLTQSENNRQVQSARLQAESGQAFLAYALRHVSLPLAGTGAAVMDPVADHLAETIQGSEAFQGGAVGYDGQVVQLPEAVLGESRESFCASLWMATPTDLRVRVTGRAGTITRTVAMDFALRGGHPIFGYGISSKGPICFENEVSVLGANDPNEARLLSTAPGTAFRLEDSVRVDGDVYASDPEADVAINGIGSIGGVSMRDPNVIDHVHFGEGFVEFPEIDTSAFEPFAREILNSETVTSGTKTFSNVRIKANTNPSFSGSITFQGVVFIEVPNRVTFGAGTIIRGVIVTEDAGTASRDNEIKFENGTVSFGVETLPDTGLFKDLREMTGSFILAPGFRVKFENDAGVINGVIAAEGVKFENSFVGTLRGGILCYGTEEFGAENGSSFTIDHSHYTDVPAGFVVEERRFEALSATYAEQ